MFNILLTLLFILITNIYSQEINGSIRGRVLEKNTLLSFPFAYVIILGSNYGASIDLDGNFIINKVPVGIYQVRASVIGYKAIVVSDVMVKPSKSVTVNFELVPEIIEIKDVVVKSDYFNKSILEPISSRSFSQEDIRRSAGGFEDVVRTISVLPGVAQSNAGRNDLIVRGGAPSENLCIVDGYEIPNINHFGTQGSTGGPISFINLDFVRDVSFSTGGFPVLFGDKISSILKINLREGDNINYNFKGTLSATSFGFDFEGPAFNQNSSFIISVRRSYLDFIFKAAGFSFLPEYYDLMTKYDHKFDNYNSISFLFIGAFDKVKFFNDTQEKKQSNARILGSDQTQYIAGFSYRRIFSNGYMNLRYYRNFTDYDSRQSDTLLNPIFQNIFREEENNFQLDIVHKIFNNFELNFGASVKLIEFDADILFPSFRTTFGYTLPNLLINQSRNFIKGSTYINLNSNLYQRVLVNAGIRFDYFNAIKNSSYFSPRLSLAYLVNDVFTLNFSTGLYKQFPSLIWLAANPVNENLKAIDAKQFIVGFDYLIREDVQFKLEGFLKNYSDYPVSVLRPYLILSNTGAGFSGSDDNFSSFGLEPLVSQGKGFSRGVEVSVQKKMSEIPLYGIFSFTYSKTEFTSLDGIKRNGVYDQNWIINMSCGYRFNMYWEISTRFRFASGRPYTPFDANGIQNVVDYNSRRLKSTHSLDLRIDRRWIFKSRTMITYIDIQNIYNQKNLSGIRWDPIKKTVDETSSIGILPSIGISVEL